MAGPTDIEPRGLRPRWRLALLAAVVAVVAVVAVALGLGSRSDAPEEAAQAAATPPDAGPAPALHGPVGIEGEVRDDLGKPLAGARVRVSLAAAAGGAAREVRTDTDGHFEIDDLPREPLFIEVAHAGHDGKEHTLQPDASGPLAFVLARQGELHVALRDLPGHSVDGAEIVLTGPGLWPAQAARASAQGEHLFEGLAAGEYVVRARRGARVAPPSRALAVVPGKRTEAELVLEQGARLAGVVIDQDTRAPVIEARVAVQDLTPGIEPAGVLTDESGQFEVSGLWPGPVRVEVQHEAYAPSSRELTLPVHERLTVELAGAAAVAGVVVTQEGAPVSGARLSVTTREGLPVELASEPGVESGQGELGVTRGPVPAIPLFGAEEGAGFAVGTLATESDAAGRFRIAQLPPRTLVLHATRPGYLPTRIVLSDLKPHAERSDLRIVLREGGSVRGRVVDARGQPLTSVYVLARTRDGAQSGLSDERGSYVIGAVLGEVTVEAQPDGRTTLRCRTLVTAGSEARCDLTATTAVHELPVRVVDEYGLGLEGAQVTLRAGGAHAGAQLSRRDGTLRLRELPPPPYTLGVTLPGWLPVEALAVEQAEREVRVRLTRAATLAGFVLDALGRAVPDALVSTLEGELTAESDAHGAFTLESVPPGPHTLIAHHPRAGEGRSSEVRARPSERLDGVRIVLAGRYQPDDDAGVARAAAARERPDARKERRELELTARGRAIAVTAVRAGTPLARAGLRAGDVLVAVDGQVPLSPAHARGLLNHPSGRVALVRVLRGKRQVHLRYRRPVY